MASLWRGGGGSHSSVLHVTSWCSNRAETFFWINPDCLAVASYLIVGVVLGKKVGVEFKKNQITSFRGRYSATFCIYSPQVKRSQFTMQRSTRCLAAIADWTSAPAHKRGVFPTTCLLSSPLISVVFIHLDAEAGGRRDAETKHSPSNSAGPTPTMMMERGSEEPCVKKKKQNEGQSAQIVQTGLFACLFSHKPSGRNKNRWMGDRTNYLALFDIFDHFSPLRDATLDKSTTFKSSRGGLKR